nr:MAG TPA: hypothetical protein [Caudoviricetes sp.]
MEVLEEKEALAEAAVEIIGLYMLLLIILSLNLIILF